MTDRIERGDLARPAHGGGAHATAQDGRIAQLADLPDFKIADGEPDPRGWMVKAADGREVGVVRNLLVDTGALEVRYLEIDARHEVLGTEKDRRLLIPIGAARLDEGDDVVHIDRLPHAKLRGAPAFVHASPDSEHERQVHGYFGTTDASRADHSRFFGARRQGREDARYLTRWK